MPIRRVYTSYQNYELSRIKHHQGTNEHEHLKAKILNDVSSSQFEPLVLDSGLEYSGRPYTWLLYQDSVYEITGERFSNYSNEEKKFARIRVRRQGTPQV